MSENLYKLWTEQFSTNLELKLQQVGSKLRDRVSTGQHTGRQASPVQEVGAVALRTPTGRFTPIQRVDADFVRRWVFPQDGELPQLIDTFDQLKTIVDPKSAYVQNAANAVGRAYDDAIIASAFATSYIGRDAAGLTTETFDEALYSVDVDFSGTGSGLTVAKLIEAKRILRHNHVDPETDQITLVIGSKQESDLLNQTQVVSTDFNDKPTLVDGRVTRFLGFDIVVSERLTTASNVRSIIAFAKSGLYLGTWKEQQNDVTQRKDLSGLPWQLYTSVSFGATRLQQGRVIEIECADTTGADITP